MVRFAAQDEEHVTLWGIAEEHITRMQREVRTPKRTTELVGTLPRGRRRCPV